MVTKKNTTTGGSKNTDTKNEINVGQDSLDIDVLGANRKFD